MTKETIIAAAKRAFHEATVTLSAESHPVEFAHWCEREAACGRFWGALLENKHEVL